MSDTSRKRSRKSKLVARECAAESEDDDVHLQVKKIPKTSHPNEEVNRTTPGVLRRLTRSANTQPTPQTSISFDIEVEVEKCDDFCIQTGGDKTVANKTEETSKITPTPVEKSVYLMRYNAAKRLNPEIKTLDNVFDPIILNETTILEAADQIIANSHNIADKVLDIGLRNIVGHGIKGNQYENIHESNIQEALDEWRTWQFKSFHRLPPLFYKCYICEKSWWYLSNFRDHITQHSHVNIALEIYERHEANIIAYQITKPDVRDFYTEGLCKHCGRDFDAHKLSSRINQKYYGNEGCMKLFFNCLSFKEHSSTCPQCITKPKNYKCDLCKSTYDTQELLNEHLGVSHTIRSDVPILNQYRVCKTCCARYSCSYLHVCGKKGPHLQCNHCFRSFSNRISFELHMESSSEAYTCQICGHTLHWGCKIYEHMMKHTKKYMLVKKCVKCDDLTVFANNDGASQHRYRAHMDKSTREISYFSKIIVPKFCMERAALGGPVSNTESLEECHKKPIPNLDQVSVPVREQQSVPVKKQESVQSKEEIISIKEESQESLPFTIKEEPIEEAEDPPEYEIQTQDFGSEFYIKEEREDTDEYEDDIIKLDINDFMIVKQEYEDKIELKQEPQKEEPVDATQSVPIVIKQESNQIPEIIIGSKFPEVTGTKKKKLYSCTKCGLKAIHREYKEHIESDCEKSYTRSQIFPCTKCSEGFVSIKMYLAHFVNHGYNCLSCPECLKQFHSFTALVPHVRSHIKDNFVRVKSITIEGTQIKPDYQCRKCNEIVVHEEFFDHWELHVTSTPDGAIEHIPTKHKWMDEESEEVIKQSINRLKETSKICNQCDREFKRVSECKRHIIEHLLTAAYTHKVITGTLDCQICGSRFIKVEKYKQHMRNHASLPVYKCELCDHSFSDSSNFTKHKKVHNLKVFVCDLCGKKFQMKLSLIKHLEEHRNTEPIKCEICDKSFFFKSAYRKHVKYIHEKKLGYPCVVCNKRFSRLKLKWDHMWEVHNERKHEADCPICFKSFRKFSDVRIHAKREHCTEVSTFSVKLASTGNTSHTSVNGVIDIQKMLRKSKQFKLGATETLVVFE